ncbi:MAG: hypothetical protein V7K48_27695 [Nostoc sp.]
MSSKTPRATVADYLKARLNSPFQMITDVSFYVCEPREFNAQIPEKRMLMRYYDILSQLLTLV